MQIRPFCTHMMHLAKQQFTKYLIVFIRVHLSERYRVGKSSAFTYWDDTTCTPDSTMAPSVRPAVIPDPSILLATSIMTLYFLTSTDIITGE